VFEPSPIFSLPLLPRAVAGMLQGLGEAETRSVIAERGRF